MSAASSPASLTGNSAEREVLLGGSAPEGKCSLGGGVAVGERAKCD